LDTVKLPLVRAWYSFGVTGFRGVQAAAVTPRGRNGEIDFGAAFELIDFLVRGCVDGIVLFAAEGEYPAFTAADRSRLCKLAVKRSRVPVTAGVGCTSVDESVALARQAQEAGAEALLVPPPHFYRYDQDDIRAFYREFANEVWSDTPILLYETGAASRIAPETAAELMQDERFAGLVYAAGDAAGFEAYAGGAAMVGDDVVLARTDAAGVISGAACAAPEVVVGLHGAIQAGAAVAAERWRGRLAELLAWSARFPQPTVWKAATELRGLKTGAIAAALSPRKQRELEEFREWFRAWIPQIRKQTANA
jgi:4-hydroxy-tetrahydrodipicolinate synthase